MNKPPFQAHYSRNKAGKLILFMAAFLFFLMPARAQNNYWTQQYGARATLTGGACMSCSNDNSVFFYNPGAVGFLDSANFSVSSNLYALDFVNMRNAVGNGLDLKSNGLNVNAQLTVGNIRFKRVPKLKLVFGFILRGHSKLVLDQLVEKNYDVITLAPGFEYYRGKLEFDYLSSEQWFGLAAAYQFNEHISFGLGHYAAYTRIQSLFYADATADAIARNGFPYSTGANVRLRYDLQHVRIMWKPGFDIRFGKIKIGIAAVLPAIKLFGKGKLAQSIQVYNLDEYNLDQSNPFGVYPNLIISADQSGVEANIKLAPSIALGFEYEEDKYRVAVAMEYFFPVEEYDLLRGKDNAFIRPVAAFGLPPVEAFTRVRTASFSVFNIAIGAELKFNPKFTFLTGFHTDFNNKVPLLKDNYTDYVSEITPISWHYINYAFGFSYQKKNKRTYLGLSYNFGFSNYHAAIVNFSEPSDDNLLVGPDLNNMKSRVHQLGFVIGYNINLNTPAINLKKKGKRKDNSL